MCNAGIASSSTFEETPTDADRSTVNPEGSGHLTAGGAGPKGKTVNASNKTRSQAPKAGTLQHRPAEALSTSPTFPRHSSPPTFPASPPTWGNWLSAIGSELATQDNPSPIHPVGSEQAEILLPACAPDQNGTGSWSDAANYLTSASNTPSSSEWEAVACPHELLDDGVITDGSADDRFAEAEAHGVPAYLAIRTFTMPRRSPSLTTASSLVPLRENSSMADVPSTIHPPWGMARKRPNLPHLDDINIPAPEDVSLLPGFSAPAWQGSPGICNRAACQDSCWAPRQVSHSSDDDTPTFTAESSPSPATPDSSSGCASEQGQGLIPIEEIAKDFMEALTANFDGSPHASNPPAASRIPVPAAPVLRNIYSKVPSGSWPEKHTDTGHADLQRVLGQGEDAPWACYVPAAAAASGADPALHSQEAGLTGPGTGPSNMLLSLLQRSQAPTWPGIPPDGLPGVSAAQAAAIDAAFHQQPNGGATQLPGEGSWWPNEVVMGAAASQESDKVSFPQGASKGFADEAARAEGFSQEPSQGCGEDIAPEGGEESVWGPDEVAKAAADLGWRAATYTVAPTLPSAPTWNLMPENPSPDDCGDCTQHHAEVPAASLCQIHQAQQRQDSLNLLRQPMWETRFPGNVTKGTGAAHARSAASSQPRTSAHEWGAQWRQHWPLGGVPAPTPVMQTPPVGNSAPAPIGGICQGSREGARGPWTQSEGAAQPHAFGSIQPVPTLPRHHAPTETGHVRDPWSNAGGPSPPIHSERDKAPQCDLQDPPGQAPTRAPTCRGTPSAEPASVLCTPFPTPGSVMPPCFEWPTSLGPPGPESEPGSDIQQVQLAMELSYDATRPLSDKLLHFPMWYLASCSDYFLANKAHKALVEFEKLSSVTSHPTQTVLSRLRSVRLMDAQLHVTASYHHDELKTALVVHHWARSCLGRSIDALAAIKEHVLRLPQHTEWRVLYDFEMAAVLPAGLQWSPSIHEDMWKDARVGCLSGQHQPPLPLWVQLNSPDESVCRIKFEASYS